MIRTSLDGASFYLNNFNACIRYIIFIHIFQTLLALIEILGSKLCY